MKRIVKSFAFWFLLLSICIIVMHQIGQDSKSIMLIGFNPLLNMIANAQGNLYHFMESGWQVSCNTIVGQISIYWYIGSLLTFTIYGLMLDGIKLFINKARTKNH